MHTMFLTLLERTPELEACAQLKNLHTSFLPMCKLPILPHSTSPFGRNHADGEFLPSKHIRSRATSARTQTHTSASAKQDLKGNHRVIYLLDLLLWCQELPISGHDTFPFSPATQPAQTQSIISTYPFCLSCPRSRLGWLGCQLLCFAHRAPFLSSASQRQQYSFHQYHSFCFPHSICAGFFCVYLHGSNFWSTLILVKKTFPLTQDFFCGSEHWDLKRFFSCFSAKAITWEDSRF